jgi:hypothetical protein
VNQKELAAREFGGYSDWQLPTLAQFDYFLIAMGGVTLMAHDVLYWSSDVSVDGNALAVSVGVSPAIQDDVLLLGKREVTVPLGWPGDSAVFVYELKLARPKAIDRSAKGACIWTATKDVSRPISPRSLTITDRWGEYNKV